jgi:hypothetical protein
MLYNFIYSVPKRVVNGGVGAAPTEIPSHFTARIGMLYDHNSVIENETGASEAPVSDNIV